MRVLNESRALLGAATPVLDRPELQCHCTSALGERWCFRKMDAEDGLCQMCRETARCRETQSIWAQRQRGR